MNEVLSAGLSDEVTRRLREAILTGLLRDGERVVERDLASTLAVSRGPVRDALRRLADEGLVVSEPRRGTRIASLTLEDGEEIMAIRLAIEPLAVRYLVRDAESPRFESLHPILDAMRAACERHDWPEVMAQDFALHSQLYRLCGRRRLLRLWESISEPLLHIFRMNLGLYENIGQVYENHRKLVAELESGDPARAEDAIREHITHFQPQLRALMIDRERKLAQEGYARRTDGGRPEGGSRRFDTGGTSTTDAPAGVHNTPPHQTQEG
ncbi:GntR family transcriptional regulator [Amycolatopsis nigrescens]|uniref:GntR family transcriptional regulator n=1 Tax=Amycolatopsis nigrescens TaxID=381445 RepID=UPI0003760B8C|nr:GntR family transcriptional regulator [Amycolatopsis nigrescens]